MSGPDDEPKAEKPKRGRPGKTKPASEYASRPYMVGKGKPPIEHQFSKGNKGGGRPRGARNKYHLEVWLDDKVQIGHDSLGRPIRRTWRNVINHQLLKKAAEGDLAAIKLVSEFDLKARALKGSSNPVQSEADFSKLAEKRKLSKELTVTINHWLDQMAQLRKLGILDFEDGNPCLSPWVAQAIREYRERNPAGGWHPGDP